MRVIYRRYSVNYLKKESTHTFVWRYFFFIFSSASQFKEILYQIQRDERLAEHQSEDALG